MNLSWQKFIRFLITAFICCYQSLASAQDLASVSSKQIDQTNDFPSQSDDKNRSLKSTLEEIGLHYQVNFMFDQSLIDQKSVRSESIYYDNFDNLLDRVLSPLKLTYKEIDKGIFIIKTAVKEEKKSQKVESNYESQY